MLSPLENLLQVENYSSNQLLPVLNGQKQRPYRMKVTMRTGGGADCIVGHFVPKKPLIGVIDSTDIRLSLAPNTLSMSIRTHNCSGR